ncbi:MAG: molybdopterin-dependent oxidoreductase [Polyangia bacterium]|jgi:4-hydroxybenzoyl-CoA reductase subunit alpha|nr:molybdopterin-dependent oxidoreductase [Polyangia bacterium]
MDREVLVTLTVNGRRHVLGVKPNTTLQNFIRNNLGLTGTKKGCELGECGACTVILNGKAVNSCMVLAVEADGGEVTTIEGIAQGGELHPLQKSFVKHGALQCGFCTPGMIMSGKALLDRHPAPSDEEIKEALSGNLCRCAAYNRILAAVKGWREFENVALDTEPRDTHERDQTRDMSVVSRGVPRIDGPDKVTGRAQYTADLHLPDMIYGKILGSPIPHGIIKRIDVSKARAVPGVLGVLTGKDVPETTSGVSPARYDEHILAKERVRYVGDEVAAVAAIDEETAERAIRLIEVEYEEFPAVFDAEEALKDGAPQVHPENPRFKNNINTKVDWTFGDVEKGFAEADLVKEQRFVTSRTYQAPIEPHAALARWEHHGGRVTLWTSTQTPHYVHHMLARVLDISMGAIRVIRPHVGAGFGVKAETTPLDFCAVIFSRMLGRPVMMKYSRKEMMLHGRGRHPQIIDLKVGVKKDGRITAVKQRSILEGGAYTSFGVITAYYAGSMVPTLYKMDNYRYEGYRMYTNLPACGAMRGHGVPPPRFAFESMLDTIAGELGMDPFEIRLKNAMEPNFMTVNALDISSCEFRATLEQARELSGWKAKHGKLPLGKGIGVGCGGFVSGAGYPIYRSKFPHSNAVVRVHEDGTGVTLHIAAAEIGQGSDTVMPQICAEELGVPYHWVWMAPCDSTLSPIDLGSYSSRVTLMAGNATKMAAGRVRKQLLEVAGRMLGCEPGSLTARDGRIFVTEFPTKGIEWCEVARRAFSEGGPVVGTGFYEPPSDLGGGFKGSTVGTSPAYSFSTCVAEVTVDTETGFVTVDRVVDFSDAGTVVNPVLFHGQVEGAMIMGMGETLLERMVHHPDGSMANPNLHDYLIPSIRETPEITSKAVESYEPRGPFGAKEIGEGSLLPIIGAIANAIYDACGVRVTELPITPERILAGLKKKSTHEKEGNR